MNHTLLLLDHKENRRLLAEWLGQGYHVLPDGEQALDEPFDLGILDGPALDRLWKRVQARKEAEQPVFLPFLLVTARQDVRYVTRHLWRTVDELILTPLEKVELQARVEILLRARQLSLELHQRYRRLFENVPLGIYRTTPDGRILDANAALVEMLGYPNREALIDIKATDSYVDPQDRRRWQELIERQGSVQHFETQLRRRDGCIIWVEDNTQAVRDAEGRVLYYEGSLQDITERRQAEGEIRRRSQELATLYHASQAFAQSLDPEVIGQRLIKVMEQLVGYEYGAVLVVDEATQEVLPLALSDQGRGPEFVAQDKEYGRSKELRVGQGIVGWVIQHGQPVRTGDVRQDPRHFAVRENIRSELCVPLVVGKKVIGAINVETSQPEAYSEDDERLLTALAGPAAVAIENARLFCSLTEQQEQLRALAMRLAEVEEDERCRLARELHDRVGQNLTALGINLNVLGSQLPPETAARMGARLADCLTLVEETTGHIRDVMAELRPAVLDDYGLLAALHWYGQRFSQRTGLAVAVQGEELTPRLPPAVETALFRIAQEALTNVARHAQASQVTVTLERVDGGIRLVIADDGVGFDPAVRRRGGWGLMTMRERAEAVGGRLRLDSAPGKGTRVVVEVLDTDCSDEHG